MNKSSVVLRTDTNRIDIFIDKLCCCLLAISPVLQHYQGFLKNAGFSVLVVISPFVFVKLFFKFSKKQSIKPLIIVLPLLLFEIDKMVSHGFSVMKFLYGFFMILMFLALAYSCIDIAYFFRVVFIVVCCAFFVLLCQYIAYYLFDYHICCVPVSCFLPESSQWILLAQTGRIGVTGKNTGFYRPSAFFLEPSHLFLYCFPILCYELLSKNITKKRIYKAIIITFAIILSTSGMGIFVSICIWGVFLCFYNDTNRMNVFRTKNLLRLDNIVLISLALCSCVMAYFTFDFVAHAVNRIFIAETGSNAIGGRISQALSLVKELSGRSLFFGYTDDVSDITFNLPGFFSTLYKYGICGIVLSYAYYICFLFHEKNETFWIGFIIIIISFFTAHSHGTFYMLFYTILLYNNYWQKEKD